MNTALPPPDPLAREVEDLYENAPCAYYSLDQQGRFLRINRHAREWLGCTSAEVVGKLGPRDFLSEETQQVFREFFPVLLQTGAVSGIEAEYVSRSGARRWVTINATVQYDDLGQFLNTRTALFDISARKRIEQELAEAYELQRVTLDSIGDAVITTDAAGIVKWLNPVAERLTGWSKQDALGRPLADVFRIVCETTGAAAEDPVARCLRAQCTMEPAANTLLISRMGQTCGIEDSAAPIRNARQDIIGAVLVFRDVSEARRLHQEMRHRATHDALTGLVNRAEFELRLSHLLDGLNAGDARVHAVMLIDLDQFKLVNDACGHAVGDLLLCQVSRLLRDAIRSGDTLARLGGDEFGVILPYCSAEQAMRVGRAICDQMELFRFVHGTHRFRIGTSIGLVEMDASWASVAILQQAADSACYRAKEDGRNRVHRVHNSDDLMQTRQGEIHWVNRLEQAMDEDQFVLYGQRIAPLQHRAHGLHCEVLLRLNDGAGGVVPPAMFLPAAERYHLAARLDRWVVRRVFAKLQALGTALQPVQLISINLSGQSVADRTFHAHLLQMVRDAHFDVRKLCFEITETAAVTNFVDVRPFIEEMRSLGVRIALDDFGAGASSFSYLKRLPVDFLKIDGQFITRLLEDTLDETAVRCFQQVAHAIDVRTIAEFVEQEPVRARLAALGVDYAQGYLLHRPEPLRNLLQP